MALTRKWDTSRQPPKRSGQARCCSTRHECQLENIHPNADKESYPKSKFGVKHRRYHAGLDTYLQSQVNVAYVQRAERVRQPLNVRRWRQRGRMRRTDNSTSYTVNNRIYDIRTLNASNMYVVMVKNVTKVAAAWFRRQYTMDLQHLSESKSYKKTYLE